MNTHTSFTHTVPAMSKKVFDGPAGSILIVETDSTVSQINLDNGEKEIKINYRDEIQPNVVLLGAYYIKCYDILICTVRQKIV